MHPFVRVHIVNKNTGCYLQNLEKTEWPVVYHNEELTAYNKIEKRYEATESDIILPFATALCDFRTLGNSRGVWNQSTSLSMQNFSLTTLHTCSSPLIHSSFLKCSTLTPKPCSTAMRKIPSTNKTFIELPGVSLDRWERQGLIWVEHSFSFTGTNTMGRHRAQAGRASFPMSITISFGITTKSIRGHSPSNSLTLRSPNIGMLKKA